MRNLCWSVHGVSVLWNPFGSIRNSSVCFITRAQRWLILLQISLILLQISLIFTEKNIENYEVTSKIDTCNSLTSAILLCLGCINLS